MTIEFVEEADANIFERLEEERVLAFVERGWTVRLTQTLRGCGFVRKDWNGNEVRIEPFIIEQWQVIYVEPPRLMGRAIGSTPEKAEKAWLARTGFSR